jgi:hypothetical protein
VPAATARSNVLECPKWLLDLASPFCAFQLSKRLGNRLFKTLWMALPIHPQNYGDPKTDATRCNTMSFYSNKKPCKCLLRPWCEQPGQVRFGMPVLRTGKLCCCSSTTKTNTFQNTDCATICSLQSCRIFVLLALVIRSLCTHAN